MGMTSHRRQPAAYADQAELSERTAIWLGLIPGLGSIYAGRTGAGVGWFVSVMAVEFLVALTALPKGGLTGFGVVVVLFLQLVAFIIWGGSIVAARRHVRRVNEA
jgi:hypothetical protein